MEIGARSGQARPERRTMKVCSSMYWPLRQAWLVPSVKTIHAEPAGNSQRSLRQLSWNAASSFMHYDNLAIKDRPASAADQIRAALAAIPGSTLNAYEVPEGVGSAARVIVSHEGKATRVYVHPESLQVLKTVDENARFMKVLFRLHG